MKNILIIALVITSTVKAQLFEGYNTKGEMEVVKYELHEIVINDSLFYSGINSIVMPYINEQCCCEKVVQYYYRMHFFQEDNSQTIMIVQSRYPGSKLKGCIGFFECDNHLFIVSGDVDLRLFKRLKEKRTFTYRDYVQPTLFTLEDDIPTWMFEYKNGIITAMPSKTM